MYINTGYLNHSHKDFKDKSRPLIVGSCGTYRLSQHPKMPTYRPRGRLDYQIIYISSGLVHFHFDNPENETIKIKSRVGKKIMSESFLEKFLENPYKISSVKKTANA